ncbi:ketohexokinase [Drosophila bipectinata]|uniref:ketohexokinase n=1 Tax=Drosophila bipectinata TaxID=42026 RepID=UPI001C88E42B|nr:ketohexokinase [Drosophila bipectinata]
MSKWCALSSVRTVLCVGCTEVDYVATVDKWDTDTEAFRLRAGTFHRSGRSSNVATVLRLMGANVDFFGVLSRLPTYRMVLDDLEKAGIGIDNCHFTDEPPPFSTIIQESINKRVTISYCDKPFAYVNAKDFQMLDLDQYGWVNFEGRNPRDTCDMINLVLKYNNGREKRDRVMVSLQIYKDFSDMVDLISMCDYVLVTKYVCEQQGWTTPHESCKSLNNCLRMPRSINVRRPCFVVPWSSLGAGCMNTDGDYFELPAIKPKRILDRVGDSDCFTAAFIYATFIRQRHLAAAVAFANAVASYKLAHNGFTCITQLNPDSLRLPVVMEGKDASSEDEDNIGGEQQRLCKKYLFRPSVFVGPADASSLTSVRKGA